MQCPAYPLATINFNFFPLEAAVRMFEAMQSAPGQQAHILSAKN
jgi:hypothetical protein